MLVQSSRDVILYPASFIFLAVSLKVSQSLTYFCTSSTLDGFEAKRDFRGVTYHITVKNPKHVEKGVSSMTVDGVSVAGNMIPLPTDKKEVTVEVIMG